jgi:purine nucleosidase/pyrimidine-specific ribonucleoside hydrolase
MTGPLPVVLDCDPGHDDAIAMLLALGSPALDLRAVTTVAGNGPLERVTDNARRILTLAGVHDVPVAAGAAGPLAGGPAITAPAIHGESALDGPALPEPAVPLDPRPAVEVLAGSADTLIATGPLTNVAQALDAGAAPREIVWMGGSTERGNREPYAEFNAAVDPEAVDRVLASGIPFTLVGLNLTHQALATDTVIERARAVGGALGETMAGWLRFFGASYRDVFGFPAPPVHDPCAVARLIEPEIVRCVDAFVAVELHGRWTRGATVVDLHGALGEPPNARVAVDLDVARFWELVIGAVERLQAASQSRSPA